MIVGSLLCFKNPITQIPDLSKLTIAYPQSNITGGESVISSSSATRHFVATTDNFPYPNKFRIEVGFKLTGMAEDAYLFMLGNNNFCGINPYVTLNKLGVWIVNNNNSAIFSTSLSYGVNYLLITDIKSATEFHITLKDLENNVTLVDENVTYPTPVTYFGYLTFGGMRYPKGDTGDTLIGSIFLDQTKVINTETGELIWGATTKF
jgi:hypothetical protein